MRQPRVGDDGDIGHRELGCRQPVLAIDHLVQLIERVFASLDAPALPLFDGFLEKEHLVSAHGDVRLVTVLFPEKKLADLGAVEGVDGKQWSAVGKELNDGVRLGEDPPVLEFDDGNTRDESRTRVFLSINPAGQVMSIDIQS